MLYGDLTEKFPVSSNRGNYYTFVMYAYGYDAILAEPIKNHTKQEIIQAFKCIHAYLKKRGLHPKYQQFDTEASEALIKNTENKEIDVQLAPLHVHCRNIAERAIQTFKDHFLAGLASVDPNFPIQLQDRLIPQA
eukprot:11721385-Ditylum_brightwellii.AAC.1